MIGKVEYGSRTETEKGARPRGTRAFSMCGYPKRMGTLNQRMEAAASSTVS